MNNESVVGLDLNRIQQINSLGEELVYKFCLSGKNGDIKSLVDGIWINRFTILSGGWLEVVDKNSKMSINLPELSFEIGDMVNSRDILFSLEAILVKQDKDKPIVKRNINPKRMEKINVK